VSASAAFSTSLTPPPSPLFPALAAGADRPALRFGDRCLTHAELASASGALAAKLTAASAGRVAVWATPGPETGVGVVAALLAGVAAVPLNPRSGDRELTHIVADSEPSLVLAAPDDVLPPPLAGLPRLDVDTTPAGPAALPPEPDAESPALVVYTSGTTGPPKGVVIPRRAIAGTLDALADAWQWTADDVVVHALPLFHVHGLILGTLGPLRRGGTAHRLERFGTQALADALTGGGTMLFAVPTMYHRIAEELDTNAELTRALAGARLLVSGSAALPVHEHERIAAATGRRVIERYGMTETLMNTSVRADDPAPRPGTVGVPLPGMELRLVGDAGEQITAPDVVGEIQVRGRSLFLEYLGRPEATAAAFDGDWFRTGDMATRDADGGVRIIGRRSTDLIKSGGYRIGAGEIENALLEHPGVREAAVTGEPDDDLGERIVAWIVPAAPEAPPGLQELADHVAARLAPHKRPRALHLRDALPRNDMGKLMKRALHA
jgi:malonyl-CoA/methylmalonyl-CoA synthetase